MSNVKQATTLNDSDIITAKDMQDISKIVDKSQFNMPLIAVYCGSRLGNSSIYGVAAKQLGQALAANNMGLVYGGATIGLMGTVADEVLKAGAEAVGVIPKFLLDREVAHAKLSKLYLTDTMHTRKAIMAEYADAFITLPGGLGTLEEIMEVATWRQLYRHEKPMIILNINGYYDRLIEHLIFSAEEGFIGQDDIKALKVCNTVEEAIDALKSVIKIENHFDSNKI